MNRLTRRSLLEGAAAIPLYLWLRQDARGQSSAPLVRYEARSPEGQSMLQTYARAVSRMQSTSEGDPTGWLFQWYTHSVKGSTTKAAELARIYPMPSPDRDLAGAAWETCQAHHPADDENNFLPWHRLFLLYFEKIIRRMSGDPSFTLPYWNYSDPTPGRTGVIPVEFTKRNDPVFKSLYIENRNQGVNQGQPIQQGQPGDPLSLEALAECDYEPGGVTQGFCMNLDQSIHGAVHVLVGDATNMGSIPWAARDPIFWLHHCSIDRLWASWNAAGRSNPALSQQFTFADEMGQAVVGNVSDVMDLGKLGYTYDKLEAVPDCQMPTADELANVNRRKREPMQKKRAVAKRTPVTLGAGKTEITLDPLSEREGEDAMPFHAQVASLAAGRRMYLVMKNLRADVQPGVLYHLYLDLPANASEKDKKAHYVGAINFFNALDHGGKENDTQTKKGPERFKSFDITKLAKELRANDLLKEKPIVTIVPVGEPAEGAKPVVGEITVVEQQE